MKWINLFLVIFLFVYCDKNPVDNDDLTFGTMTDIDGNVYKTIKIGNQEWMAENLRVTRYKDGSAIAHLTGNSDWNLCQYTRNGAYCFYNNTTNTDSINKFGSLYNFYAVDTRKLAPPGWHIPAKNDWNTFWDYLIAETGNTLIAKAMAATTDWCESEYPGAIGNDLSKNNTSGFSALPGGSRWGNGQFGGIGCASVWWIAGAIDSLCSNITLHFDGTGNNPYDDDECCGFSVRLVRD